MLWLTELKDNSPSYVEKFVDNIATERGYDKITVHPNDKGRMSSYNKRGFFKIHVYLTTGTIATCLDHPRRGKSQLFRKNLSLREIKEVFENPRAHTGKGYWKKMRDPGPVFPEKDDHYAFDYDGWYDSDD